MAADAASLPRGTWAGPAGFALGDLDGILLHQILQWHHLLSGVQSGLLRDLRMQVMADGLFHLLMYVIALAGFWSLWRSRRLPQPPDGARLLADALVGFGSWHVVDAVLSHGRSVQPHAWMSESDDVGVEWIGRVGLVKLAAARQPGAVAARAAALRAAVRHVAAVW